jgi:putative phage-type endonuclease
LISAKQCVQRRNFIGSSDCAALFGLDPFKSASDVYTEKTARLKPSRGTAATDRGTLLEPAILQWARREIGHPFKRNVFRARDYICANFDGIHDGLASGVDPFIVEAKTTTATDDYGDPGTDEVPDRVVIQCTHQFAVAGEDYRQAYVPVLMPHFGQFTFRMYIVQRDDELVELVAEKAREFKRKYIDTLTKPPDFRPSLDVLKRIRREPKSVVPVADELVDALIAARAAKKQACDDVEAAEKALLAALADAEGGEFSRGLVTYFETKRNGYTVDACTYRSLKIKGAK